MGKKVTVILNNNKCQLTGTVVAIQELREELKMKHPNAFYVRPYMPPDWDNHMRYISDRGYMSIGYLPWLNHAANKLNIELTFVDYRPNVVDNIKVVNRVGNNTLRPYQKEAVKAVLMNKVAGVRFPIGGINAATNAGKTTMMAAIFKSVPGARAIMLLNDSDLFKQFERELPELLPDTDLGFVQGAKRLGELKADFVVAQVKTLSMNVKFIHNDLAGFDICLVDEYDLADNKTYKSVIERLYNSSIRVGLSGTAFMGKLKKHQFKHASLKKFFGEEVFKITKKELVKLDVSTRLTIRIYPGNTRVINSPDWMHEYDRLITDNLDRNKAVLDLVLKNIQKKRLPILIICRFKPHVINMYNLLREELPNLKIDWAHSDKKNRAKVLTSFRNNELDILVGSYILNRGKNFPYIQAIINASGSDSPEIISQIMGRGERKHHTKNRTYIYDFYDEGRYLKRHSKHRINYYKAEGFRVLSKS